MHSSTFHTLYYVEIKHFSLNSSPIKVLIVHSMFTGTSILVIVYIRQYIARRNIEYKYTSVPRVDQILDFPNQYLDTICDDVPKRELSSSHKLWRSSPHGVETKVYCNHIFNTRT